MVFFGQQSSDEYLCNLWSDSKVVQIHILNIENLFHKELFPRVARIMFPNQFLRCLNKAKQHAVRVAV